MSVTRVERNTLKPRGGRLFGYFFGKKVTRIIWQKGKVFRKKSDKTRAIEARNAIKGLWPKKSKEKNYNG